MTATCSSGHQTRKPTPGEQCFPCGCPIDAAPREAWLETGISPPFEVELREAREALFGLGVAILEELDALIERVSIGLARAIAWVRRA